MVDLRARKKMVRWLSPSALLFTAVDMLISALFGKYSDKRDVELLADRGEVRPFPDEHPMNSVWIDYVADVGDGWDSTFSIAWLLTRTPGASEPSIRALKGTERGRILVFGGDAVYPKAGKTAYEERLLTPYRAATADEQPADRVVYAVPGNHDWYDGLTSFLRLFCRNSFVATWRAPQTRSYFALQLPHRWWLLGIDMAFDYYLDEGQLAYFRSLRCRSDTHAESICGRKIHADDQIILCTPRPGWEVAALSGDFHFVRQRVGRTALYDFEAEITSDPTWTGQDGWGCHLEVVLSGDLHHYVHYVSEEEGQPHRITSGGGGAFLFPTHASAKTILWPSDGADGPQVAYERTKEYPDLATSKRWRWLIPFAPVFANPSFAFMVGVIYLLLGLLARRSIHPTSGTVLDAIRFKGFWGYWFPPNGRPLFVIVSVLIFLALRAFADARTTLGRVFLEAIPHWFVHMYVVTVVIVLGETLAQRWFPSSAASAGAERLLFVGVASLVIVAVGGVIGGFVMGFYLFFAQLFGRHPGEAFAAMHLTRYKGFLRIHVHDGGLTIYPIGVRRVIKRTQQGICPDPGGSLGRLASTELIEKPISIPARDHP